jgi:nitrate reductase gamma subunit
MSSATFDLLLFAILPYVALVVFFLATVGRYWNRPFSYSSYSSQFLENRFHFWALVPFHYGILTVLAISSLSGARILLGTVSHCGSTFSKPPGWRRPAHVGGLVGITLRRSGDPKVKVVTSRMD